jgi:hypothetical protein
MLTIQLSIKVVHLIGIPYSIGLKGRFSHLKGNHSFMKRGGQNRQKLYYNTIGIWCKSFVEVGKYSSVFLLRSRKFPFNV